MKMGRSFALLALCLAVTLAAPLDLYTSIEQASCTRLFHSKGSTGCGTPREPVAAPIYPVSTKAQLNTFLASKSLRSLLLPASMWTEETVDLLQETSASDFIAGILLDVSTAPPEAYSGAAKTPNGEGTPSASVDVDGGVAWNPGGSGDLQAEMGWPLVAVSGEQARTLRQQAAQNVAWGLDSSTQWTARFNFYMGPPVMDSLTCLAMGGVCDPLGGFSAIGSFGLPPNVTSSQPAKKVVLATAAMDSTALIHDMAVGGNAGASQIVALLAAADALATAGAADLPQQIAIALFNGETYGFIGSRLFAQEAKNFTCEEPVAATESSTSMCKLPRRPSMLFRQFTPDRVSAVVAVDQVGSMPLDAAQRPQAFVHSNGDAGATAALVQTLVDVGSDASAPGQPGVAIARSAATGLPPSPATTFVREAFGEAAAVLTGYDATFTNRYYHSIFDNTSSINTQQLTRFSTTLARALWRLAGGAASTEAGLQVNGSLVQDAAACLTQNFHCPLVADRLGLSMEKLSEYVNPAPVSLYTGVYISPEVEERSGGAVRMQVRSSLVANFIQRSLSIAMSPPINSSSTAASCSSDSDCSRALGAGCDDCVAKCNANRCVFETAFLYPALSPALKETAKRGEYEIVDRSVPLWTEPRWTNNIGVLVYQAQTAGGQWLVMLAGLFVLAVTVGATHVILRRCSEHYKTF